MTSHPNRGWRGRWVVTGNEARHGPSGLVVRFQRSPDDDVWDGEAVNAAAVVEALRAARGDSNNLERTLARLMREAGDIFSEKHDNKITTEMGPR